MSLRRIIMSIFFLSGCLLIYAQSSEKAIQKGNSFYKNQQYAKAKEEFSKINENDSLREIAQYNLGNTLYRLGKKDEAIKALNQLSNDEKDSAFQAKLSYNEGVIFSSEQQLEESIDAYEKALLLNPNDNQARENLQKALLELKKKNTPPDKKPQQQQSKMSSKDAEQKLKKLEQKEKLAQQRVQQEKAASTSSAPKDW